MSARPVWLWQVDDAPHRSGRGASADRIGAQPSQDVSAHGRRIDRAGRRPGQVDGDELLVVVVGFDLEAHAYLPDRVGGVIGPLHPVLAEQAEMDVADLAGRPPVEQVLAVRLDSFEHGPVDACCVGSEATLGTGHPHGASGEQLAVISGDPVDGMTLGHRVERTMERAWS